MLLDPFRCTFAESERTEDRVGKYGLYQKFIALRGVGTADWTG